MKAEGHRHLATLWKSKERCWEWWALAYGHAQPVRWALGRDWGGPWWRRNFTFHLTPIHLAHWTSELEIGLCIGRRTLYLKRHR